MLTSKSFANSSARRPANVNFDGISHELRSAPLSSLKGVGEIVWVVRPGRAVAAYAWDLPSSGFTFEPRADVSTLKALRDLSTGPGLEQVETREISVTRSFSNFDDFWTTGLLGSVGQMIASLPAAHAEALKSRAMACLPVDRSGRITYAARANTSGCRCKGAVVSPSAIRERLLNFQQTH